MASKFFPWTKGDRRNDHAYRVDGLISVDQYPVDRWDSPSDLAASKKRKKRQRPKPLQLPSTASRAIIDASSTATAPVSNILAAANDMLRSPVFDDAFSLPQPNPARPRSRTAPPTPTIAELPGSILLENQGFPGLSKNAEAGQENDPSTKRKTLASPLQMSAPAARIMQHKKSLSLNTATSRWGSTTAAGSSRASGLFHQTSVESGSSASQEKRSDNSSLLHTPITEVTESSGTCNFAGSESSNVSAKPMRQTQVSDSEQLNAIVAAQNRQIALLKSQFQHLRISHEAHASTLAEAHRKELEAMKAYVHYLEESRDSKSPRPHLSIPTRDLRGTSPEASPPTEEGKPPSISDTEATQTKPDDSNTMEQVNEASISAAETQERVNELNRKLDLATKHIAAMKDQMEMLVARKDAYKDRAADLEVRVQNNHELLVDLRESEYKLELERRLMHEKYRELKGELDSLRAQPEQIRISNLEKSLAEEKLRAELFATQLETMQLRTPMPDTVAELGKTIDDLKELLKEKDEQLYELQHVNQALKLDLEEMNTQQTRVAAQHEEALASEALKRKAVRDKVKQLDHENTELKEIVEAQGEDLVVVQDEYERLRKLLHSEVRRQAREAISKSMIPGTPSSADGYLELVAAETRKRVRNLIAKEGEESPLTDPQERIEELEREIQHHVKELIRCKRDNRGYRKDIKRANTKLDKMRNSICNENTATNHLQRHLFMQRPITPTTEYSPTNDKPDMDGLGISGDLPSPTTSVPLSQANTTVSGNISEASTLLPQSQPTAPTRSRSNTNKKLPPYPSLPEQIPENASDPSAGNPPPPPSSSYSQDPPPSSLTSRPRTPRTPTTYKLTPTITERTPSVSSIRPNPSGSPAMLRRPAAQRYYSSENNNNNQNEAVPAPRRTGTQRSLPENTAGAGARPEEPPRPKTSGSTSKDARRRKKQQDAAAASETKDNNNAAADDDDPNAITALPQRPPSGWRAERKSQEEKLGLLRMRSVINGNIIVNGVGVEGIVGSALLRRATTSSSGSGGGSSKGGSSSSGRKKSGSASGAGLGAQGVVSRFNTSSTARKRAGTTGGIMGLGVKEGEDERGSWKGEVVVPVVLEGAAGRKG
ncbi:Intracellular protein transport protein USO1 [Lasiodiplodia theobromae]|uniref:Intracellular protein transport protein USO1 n=1 Tax=Lasiodiplodia theobromae TaxID=45133 RepID=A0A5N5DEK2_9PEZI|nr:Intracellular protein transport protein USO1 [Lasiodiplodia theobromae]